MIVDSDEECPVIELGVKQIKKVAYYKLRE